MNEVIERSHFLQVQLSKLQHSRSEHALAIKELDERIQFLDKWARESKEKLCSECNGHGMIREFIAQDHVRAVKCETCNGTGLKAVAEIET